MPSGVAALIAAACVCTLAVGSDAASGAPPPVALPPSGPPPIPPLLPAAPPHPPQAAPPRVSRIAITGGVVRRGRLTLEVQCLQDGTVTFMRAGQNTAYASARWVCARSHSQVGLTFSGSDARLIHTTSGLRLHVVLRSGGSTLSDPLVLHDVARSTQSVRGSAAAAPCPGSVSRYRNPVFGRCWALVEAGAIGNGDVGGRIRVAPSLSETLGARSGEEVWWRALVYWYGPRLRTFDWWAPPDELASGGWHSYVPRAKSHGATNVLNVDGLLTNRAGTQGARPVAASLKVLSGYFYWPVIQSYSASNGYATFTVYARYGHGSGSVSGDNWIYFDP